MKTTSKISILQKILAPLRQKKRIGFVPTMGALHEGHLSLIKRGKQECDFVIVSIFVNPLQFGPSEDFKSYPRTLKADEEKVRAVETDLLWTPRSEELYPSGFQSFVEVKGVTERWEGAARPDHFRGVTTVVALLFQIVQPDRSYFGQKDYQQVQVIKKMISDLRFSVSLKMLPTVREPDGLAMSSRNVRLSPADRKMAPILYRALQQAKNSVRKGAREGRVIVGEAESILRSAGLEIDYVALCDPSSLEPIDRLHKRAALLAAVRIGSVRLIDNVLLNVSD